MANNDGKEGNLEEMNWLYGSWLSFMVGDHGCANRGPAAVAGGDPIHLRCFSGPCFSLYMETGKSVI
jgi:hypothetical protein